MLKISILWGVIIVFSINPPKYKKVVKIVDKSTSVLHNIVEKNEIGMCFTYSYMNIV